MFISFSSVDGKKLLYEIFKYNFLRWCSLAFVCCSSWGLTGGELNMMAQEEVQQRQKQFLVLGVLCLQRRIFDIRFRCCMRLFATSANQHSQPASAVIVVGETIAHSLSYGFVRFCVILCTTHTIASFSHRNFSSLMTFKKGNKRKAHRTLAPQLCSQFSPFCTSVKHIFVCLDGLLFLIPFGDVVKLTCASWPAFHWDRDQRIVKRLKVVVTTHSSFPFRTVRDFISVCSVKKKPTELVLWNCVVKSLRGDYFACFSSSRLFALSDFSLLALRTFSVEKKKYVKEKKYKTTSKIGKTIDWHILIESE